MLDPIVVVEWLGYTSEVADALEKVLVVINFKISFEGFWYTKCDPKLNII